MEPDAAEVLSELIGRYQIAIARIILLNCRNRIVLRDNDISEYFDFIIGRELMKVLKPSPDGYLHVMDEFKHSANEWLSVGDFMGINKHTDKAHSLPIRCNAYC